MRGTRRSACLRKSSTQANFGIDIPLFKASLNQKTGNQQR
jgi:hypothetical protein